jgi:hypothetical protein
MIEGGQISSKKMVDDGNLIAFIIRYRFAFEQFNLACNIKQFDLLYLFGFVIMNNLIYYT